MAHAVKSDPAKNEEEVFQAGPTAQLEGQKISPGRASLLIDLDLPEGFRLNDGSPSSVTVGTPDRLVMAFGPQADVTISRPEFPLRIPAAAEEGQTGVDIHLAIYYCAADGRGPCHFHEARLNLPVTVQSGSGRELRVRYVVPPPPPPKTRKS
jgi:hypothetical protein